MTSEQWRTLGLWMVIALAAGGVSFFLGHRWRVRVRVRRQRLATWSELCLRLELVAEPGEGRVASGRLQGMAFSLRDTGVHWLLEVPLPQPLLPPGVVLLLGKALEPGSSHGLRPLPVGLLTASPKTFAWYASLDLPPSKVDASKAFLEEARRAMEAHAPLEVVPHRLIHTLREGPPPSVRDVREAVRALDATARRWLDAVEAHGLPRVDALPPPAPSSHSRSPGVGIPLKGVLSVLGGLAFVFSCCFPVLSMMRNSWSGKSDEHTGRVVGISWTRTLRHMRCPHVPHMSFNGGDAELLEKSGCAYPWKDVDYLRTSGGFEEPPRWPEPVSVRAEDYLLREESYTLNIEYEDVGKKVVTYEVHSEGLYRLFNKPGQQVSFRLRNGRVSHLRPE
jgi:hypothetical protein